MLALVTLASYFLDPLGSLVASGQRLQLVRSHLERVSDVLEAEPEQHLQDPDSTTTQRTPAFTERQLSV